MRILHLPTNTGGNAYGLSRGERALGHQSDVLVAQGNYLTYPADRLLFPLTAHGKLQKMWRRFSYVKEFFAVRSAYDVFHFNCGSSLIGFPGFGFPLLEIPFYNKNAKIVFTYNGCDARQKIPSMQRNPHAACHDPLCYDGQCNDGTMDKHRQQAITRMSQYAHTIFAVNPDLLYFLPERARFLPYTVAGWNDLQPIPWKEPAKKLRIVHAPTNRAAKGSDAVFAAMKILEREFPDTVEFILIEGLPYAEALKLYSTADLVIDQLRIGWYGGLAVEVMKLGKPVIAYIREEDLHFLPKDMTKDTHDAFIHATETTLVDVLRLILENRELLRHKHEAALAYVHRWHDPTFVARLTTEAYEA